MTDASSNTSTSRHRHAVFITCDENYFPYTLFLASEIAMAFPQRRFDICIIHSGEAPHHPLAAQHDLRLIPFSQQDRLDGLQTNRHLSIAAFQRIAVPEMLKDDYDRLLYLDVDIRYQRGDLHKLFEIDLSGHPVAAVLDPYQHRKMGRCMTEFKAAGLDNTRYFNSGVMLIDVKAYLEQDICERALEFAQRNDPKLSVQNDQSALNLALYDNWVELGPVWNWPACHHYISYRHFVDPCFLHYMGKRKPWNDVSGYHAAIDVNAYSRFIKTHFPERFSSLPTRHVHDKHAWKWPLLFLRQVKDYYRIRPYLTRFSEDDFELK
ncbi:Lipopolysaccharide biosynthesis protein, LPS:glycosyltransferase [Aliiroseovarius halocynthiae]|nr:Lipopolysaccharide biosynthesis protein, LPS:glycosyltransferase [Aliiroseovarius halocynthiae]